MKKDGEVRERERRQYIPVYRIKLVRSGSVKTSCKVVDNPGKAAEIIENYIGQADREIFVVVMLDRKNNAIGINTVTIGCLDTFIVHPREVLKPAILSNAAAIIIAHNHPSGYPILSIEDFELTGRLEDACKIMGIKLLDHIIIGYKRYFSMKDHGLLKLKD